MLFPDQDFIKDMRQNALEVYGNDSSRNDIRASIVTLVQYIRSLEKRVSILEGNNDDSNQ